MGEDEIYSALQVIFSDIFVRDDIVLTPDLTAGQVPGWDSFRQIEIILAVQREFGIKFTTRELDGLENVGELVRVVAGKLPP